MHLSTITRSASLLLGILALSAGVAMAAPQTLKISLVTKDGDMFTKVMRDTFKPMVEEKSNGKYKVEIYAGGSLGNSDTVIQGTQFGTIHMAIESTSNISQFVPEFAVFDMPYMFPTLPSISKAVASPAGQALRERCLKKKINALKIIPSSFRTIATSMPVNRLEDVANIKLRTTSSKLHILGIKSLGMAPTPMPVSEMLTGMQQGVVQGFDPDLNFYFGAGFIDVAKHVFLSDHAPVTNVLFCSSKWFDKLSAEDRAIITEALDKYESEVISRNAAALEKLIRENSSKGLQLVKPSAEEKARWIAKSEPAYEELPENLKKIALDLRAAARAE
ncbi:MAG: TRAP transporter substrate-binding protein [Mailhella sp.]|nr:TRAP transporter substrate-binding protein [Mailhella sp.]